MKIFAEKTEEQRITIEDLQDYCLKVFGDVFEALIAAVFLDTDGDYAKT